MQLRTLCITVLVLIVAIQVTNAGQKKTRPSRAGVKAKPKQAVDTKSGDDSSSSSSSSSSEENSSSSSSSSSDDKPATALTAEMNLAEPPLKHFNRHPLASHSKFVPSELPTTVHLMHPSKATTTFAEVPSLLVNITQDHVDNGTSSTDIKADDEDVTRWTSHRSSTHKSNFLGSAFGNHRQHLTDNSPPAVNTTVASELSKFRSHFPKLNGAATREQAIFGERGNIVKGPESDITEHPYQLAMSVDGEHWCGAAIIGEDWAITAAHCLQRYGRWENWIPLYNRLDFPFH